MSLICPVNERNCTASERSLWSAYIDAQLRNFKEPQRLETPKWDPVGTSKQKYHAKLLRFSGKLLGDIAKEIGVNKGTVRNWNMEEDFKKFSLNDARSFVDFYISHIDPELKKVIEGGRESETLKRIKKIMVDCLRLKVNGGLYKRNKPEGDLDKGKESIIDLSLSILRNPEMKENNRKEVFLLLSFYKDILT